MRERSRRGRRFEPTAPKPFDFVPFVSRVERERVPGHDRFHLDGYFSGQLDYELMARSHIFVSSGNYALSEDIGFAPGEVIRSCYRVTVDGQSVPAIPGSSFKGAVRAIAEAVSKSCIGVTRVRREMLPGPKALARTCRPPNLCPACAIFGAMGRLGRVSFNDALLTKGKTTLYRIPALYRPRPVQARRVYLDRKGKYKGRKFYFHGQKVEDPKGGRAEVIAEGSKLTGRLDFTNLGPDELGLVFFALGLDGSFRPMLGGGKPVCLGAIEVMPRSLALTIGESFTDYDAEARVLEGEELVAFIQKQIEGAIANGYILTEQRDRLREVLDPDNPRLAPLKAY